MNNNEKYYRRSYNAIERLIKTYRNGYSKENMLKFRSELQRLLISNPKVYRSEFNNLMFTTNIALLGLNKESMENSGKFDEYKKNIFSVNLGNISEEQDLRLKEFYNSNTVPNDFDNWLSISKGVDSDTENIDHLRRVRNALLHSNFSIDEDTPELLITKLKTKSYYEAELFNLEFNMFVTQYFSNIDSLGLSEVMHLFNISPVQIKNKDMLEKILELVTINEISYKNLKDFNEKSPELILKECLRKDFYVNMKKFLKDIDNSKNFDDFNIYTGVINKNYINYIIKHIEKTYGEKFYTYDYEVQDGIISTYLRYLLNPKTELSNWMTHFWYLHASVNNPKFNPSFFDGDEYGFESCYPALMVLKSYLVLYRLQNNDFDEIDYSKIDLDPAELLINLTSANVDGSPVTGNYINDSIAKEINKGILKDPFHIINKIACEIIRDSLAHGNIKTSIDATTLKPIIEFKDIYKNNIRILTLPISSLEKFLNSEAFLPKNCYQKDDEKVLKKEM